MISFDDLKDANLARLEAHWPGEDPWEPWDWTNAISGEAGEMIAEALTLVGAIATYSGSASNLSKKMNRMWPAGAIAGDWNHKTEDQRFNELRSRLLAELADMVIYGDILASKLGAELGDVVREKFNAKSIEIGSTVRL